MPRPRSIVLCLLAALAVASPASAQTWPSRPITMMVGFPPGGPTDAQSRIIAEGMKDRLGQSIVVETVSGAGGPIATGRGAHAAPDGYTIGIGNWSSHVGGPALYNLDYDVLKDVQPIALLSTASPGEGEAAADILAQSPGDAEGFTALFCCTNYDLRKLGQALYARGRSRVIAAATSRATATSPTGCRRRSRRRSSGS